MEGMDCPPSLVAHPDHGDGPGLGCTDRVLGCHHAQPQYGRPFPLGRQCLVLGLMLFQRIKKIGISTQLPGSLFWELGQGSDRHLPAMESMDRFLYQAGRRSRSEVLDSRANLGRRDSGLQNLFESICANSGRPGQGDLGTVRAGALSRIGVFPEEVFSILVSGCPVCHPFLGELIVSLRRPIFFDRTLIWTTIPLYLVLAAGGRLN